VDEAVFAESGDMTLLGVRTLEGFGVNPSVALANCTGSKSEGLQP
jgi:hypothetical protein